MRGRLSLWLALFALISLLATSARAESASRLVIIASTVSSPEILARAAEPGTEVIVLPRGAELARVRELVLARAPVSSLAIVAHGAPGRVELGDDTIDRDTMLDIAGALSEDARIGLYACSSGKGEEGRALIDSLARNTGASVFASTHVVGQGGSWDLDAKSIGSATWLAPFAAEAVAAYPDALPTITTQPTDRAVVRGYGTTFTVIATCTGGCSYQWYRGAVGVTTSPVGTGISTFSTGGLLVNTSFWVRVTDSTGSVDSNEAKVAVASTFVFLQQPTNTIAGANISPSVVVQLRDAAGADVALSGVSITVALQSGTGSLAGTKVDTTSVSGKAVFSSLSISQAGTKSLSASQIDLGSVTSSSFVISAGTASIISANSGFGQTATVGTAVAADPSVKVTDSYGNARSGVSVTFAVASGGGSVTGATVTTDGTGVAYVGSWTLGTVAGTNTLRATSTGLAGSPVTFTATGVAGSATTIAINAGDGQSAKTNTAVAINPSVKVTDTYGNAKSGVSVTFAVATGGGAITGATTSTNTSGIATVGSWTLGPAEGPNTLTASSTGLTGSPITFNATAADGSIAFAVAPSAAVVGAAIAPPVVVHVADGSGVAVALAPVTLALASGTGALAGTLTVSTNSSGDATFGDLRIDTAGTKTLAATAGFLRVTSAAFVISAAPMDAGADVGAEIGDATTSDATDALPDTASDDGTTVTDSFTVDTAVTDAIGSDTSAGDTTAVDTSVDDTLVDDTLVDDTLVEDTLVDDTLVEDTYIGPTTDSGVSDTQQAAADSSDDPATPAAEDSGCGCRVVQRTANETWGALAAFALALAAARRRGSRAQPASTRSQ